MEKKGFGLSGSTLKIIAIVTMLIDHVAAVVLTPVLVSQGIFSGNTYNNTLLMIYGAMRSIGRLAFPIFCFLLVEGFFHTRSRFKYAARLFLFAVVSELPFDLAFYQAWAADGHQNVFFTLFLGLAMLMAIDYFKEKLLPYIRNGKNLYSAIGQFLIFLLAAVLAGAMHTDYSYFGIIAIAGMYFLHDYRGRMCAAEAVFFFSFEPPAIFSFLPIWLYNGKRGLKMKYFFYVFYPGHLLLLYGITRLIPAL